MQDILTCAMGLDIHRDIIVACLAKGELGADPKTEIRSFSTLIPEMRKLRNWIGSFIPDKAFRELRHLTHYRESIVHDITAQKNRIDKFLQGSEFRFAALISLLLCHTDCIAALWIEPVHDGLPGSREVIISCV